jgi:lysophospholipase L1-like esterase
MGTSRIHNKKMSVARLIAGNIAVLGLLLVIIEGLASFGLLVRDVMTTNILAERRHTRYDPDLGWVSEPNVYIPDLYGPGIYLRINAQGFRNDHDINSAVPDGMARIVCVGDSFTFGYGVDNAHTWCELLSLLEPRLETVNMGQGGYGVDQAYLWYKRDASKIEHQVQLLAFITSDFDRMQSDSFWGYRKPVLEVEDGTLTVKNVPVPRRSYYFPWITQNIEHLKRLRTFEFLNRGLQKIMVMGITPNQLPQRRGDEKTQKVLEKIFEDLKRINEQRSSTLVLVYLPTLDELQYRAPSSREWTRFLEEQSRLLRIPLINFFSEWQSLPSNEIANLFIPRNKHFNDVGNGFVARAILDKLMRHPAISYTFSARWNHQ